jgi:hypothetical protein
MTKSLYMAAVLLAGVTAAGPFGVAAAMAERTVVKPAAAFLGEIGGRHVVGYYMADAGSCAVTMMLADPASEDAPATAASRLTMTLQPAASAALDAGAGDRLAVTCGEGARNLIVDSHPAAGKLASR